MQDQNQSQLELLVFTFILLFFFSIVSAGFLFGVLVEPLSVPAEFVTALPFLVVALVILAVGGALTVFMYWSVRVAQLTPHQNLRQTLVTYTMKRSSRKDPTRIG